MDNKWLKVTPSLTKGIAIVNSLEETKCEQLMKKVATKMKTHEGELFTRDEKQKLEQIFGINENDLTFALKTIVYLLKRLYKYVFQPIDLKNSLESIGFNSNKADLFIKIWSNYTKHVFHGLNSNDLNISWNLRAELSNEYQKKVKIPKAYLALLGENCQEIELTHPELYSMFLQFEAIQTELDSIM